MIWWAAIFDCIATSEQDVKTYSIASDPINE